MPAKPNVRTLAQAKKYVSKVGYCLVFPDKKKDLPNLWDMIDLPEKQPGEKDGVGKSAPSGLGKMNCPRIIPTRYSTAREPKAKVCS